MEPLAPRAVGPLTPEEATNVVFMVLCSALVLLMVLGFLFFYSGLTQRRSALLMFTLPWLLLPVVTIEWFIVGYSLCYSHNQHLAFLGRFTYLCFQNLESAFYSVSLSALGLLGTIPAYSHALFMLLFKFVAASVAFPVVCERGRLLPMVVFVIIWALVIYNPVVYWHWNSQGWLHKLSALEYAGGNPVHTMAGVVALTYSYMLGPRSPATLQYYRSSNAGWLVTGTFLCLVGWVGFVGGCSYGVSLQTLILVLNLLFCGCTAGLVWLGVDYLASGKLSAVGFCLGLISGLVVASPAAGFIPLWLAFVYGVVGGMGCNFATRIKFWIQVDDALDIFAIHGVGGVIGSLLTGIFASSHITNLSGSLNTNLSKGGWLDHHFMQLVYQLASVGATVGYVFGTTFVTLWVLNKIPLLSLRMTPEQEAQGMDELYFGEYVQDFVEFLRVLDPNDYQPEEEFEMREGLEMTVLAPDGPMAELVSQGTKMRTGFEGVGPSLSGDLTL